MLENENNKINNINNTEEEENVLVPLNSTEEEILNNIIQAQSRDELEHQFDLFNINQSKKNALRVVKLTNLLSKVEDQAIKRFNNKPDQFSNRELLDYMQAVSSQIQQSQTMANTLVNTNTIEVKHQKNEVNINLNQTVLDRDSKEKVVGVISDLLKQLKNTNNQNDNELIIDAQSEAINNSNTDSDVNLDQNTVLLNSEELNNVNNEVEDDSNS